MSFAVTVIAVIAVIALRPTPRPTANVVKVAIVAGALEVIGNGVYIIAAREGLVSVVGVRRSLAPMSTVVLARVLLGEFAHLSPAAGSG